MQQSSKYQTVIRLLDQVSLVRPNDDHNIDLLISKPNLYCYVNKNHLKVVEKLGIPTPQLIDSKYLHLAEIFINLRNEDPFYKNCVPCFFTRVPEDLPRSQEFLEIYSPIRILLARIKRAKEGFKIWTCNFPNYDRLKKLEEDEIHKLCQKEKLFYKYFSNSKHPYFLDVPMAVIECEQGLLPGFACKILEETTQEET
jgi:hypothetical protein